MSLVLLLARNTLTPTGKHKPTQIEAKRITPTTNHLNAATFLYTWRAGITAAAGTRLALSSLFRADLMLYQ